MSEGSGQPCWVCSHLVLWRHCMNSTVQKMMQLAEFIRTLQQTGTL